MTPGLQTRTDTLRDERKAYLVVNKSLSLLEGIRDALLEEEDDKAVTKAIFLPSHRRLVDALFDLVSLEGICPHLLPAVGIPIESRVKTVLQNGVVADGSEMRPYALDPTNFPSTVSRLAKLASNGPGAFTSMLQERILVDIVASLLQIIFGPQCDLSQADGSIPNFEEFLARYGLLFFHIRFVSHCLQLIAHFIAYQPHLCFRALCLSCTRMLLIG